MVEEGQNAAELVAEIEETRARLERNLDTLAARLPELRDQARQPLLVVAGATAGMLGLGLVLRFKHGRGRGLLAALLGASVAANVVQYRRSRAADEPVGTERAAAVNASGR